ncbi:MAG: hypothetical protein HZB15_12505 [Actinobacteria bacterium]|nr:hypothetical protein [Actinomycetota bacterium]
MDIFEAVDPIRLDGEPLPSNWLLQPSLAEFDDLAGVARAIGRLNDESDEVLGELFSLASGDPLVTPVVLAGLSRLMLLCRGKDRALLNDLTTEVAITIGEMRRAPATRMNRRLGYVIVDRARDRQRAAIRRQLRCPIFDPIVVAATLPEPGPEIDEVVAGRLRLQALRSQIEASGDPGLARSWNTLLELVETPRSSQADRDRWKYVRRRLVQKLGPDHAA